MKIEQWDIEDIIPYENNPRVNDDAVEKTAMSIREYGWQQPIVVDANGVIIVGHTRLKAAKSLNLDQCPVLVADNLSEAQAKAYRIADNKTGELADWDEDLLGVEINDLFQAGFDVSLTGFELDDFDFLTDQKPIVCDPDNAPAPPKEPKTNPGDLWLLGDHRLLCGDSTKQVDVDRLMDGGLADMVFTDPPYNVNYETKVGKIDNDNMTDNEFRAFLLAVYKNYFEFLKPGGCIYVAHADSEGVNFRSAFVESGLLLKQCLVWVKNAGTLSRSDYNWQHEPILYGWKPGAAHYFCKNFKLTTVIDDTAGLEHMDKSELLKILFSIKAQQESTAIWENKPIRNDLHPTMKPIQLVSRFIINSSMRGELVLDLFGGSGSTLIACEQSRRLCRLMEIDPIYCDVIVQRWEEYTGKKAELII